MTDGVRVDPADLVRLARASLAAAAALGDAWAAARPVVALPAGAYGNSDAAPAFASGVADVESVVDDAWQRIVAAFEEDADRLHGVAFAYQQADRRASDRLHGGLT